MREELRFGAFFGELRGEELVAVLAPRAHWPVSVVADIGGGDGSVSFGWAREALVVCADVDDERMRIGRDEASRRALQMRYVRAHADRLPLRDQSVDVVLLSQVLETLPRPADAVIEAGRILRRGGLVACVTPNPRSPITIIDDPHTRLPFARLLPRRLALGYARAFGRRMPSLGEPFNAPSWRELTVAFRSAGLEVELESTLLLKLSHPEFVLSTRRRGLARALGHPCLRALLTVGLLAALRRAWDRYVGRSWLLVARKP